MIPYLVTFIGSTVLCTLGQKIEKSEKDRTASNLFYGIALCALCALAGGRDLTIGSDTAGYGIFVFKAGVNSSNFFSFINTLDESRWDIGFLFAISSYVVIRLCKSQFIYFFCIELLVLVPAFIAIKQYTNRHLGVVLLAYCFTLYIPSLNMMRQSIAMGFSLLALTYWMQPKKIRSAILFCVAFLFHYTAIVVLLFMIIWVIIIQAEPMGHHKSYNKLSDWVKIQLLTLFVFSIVALLIFPQLASLFSGISHLDRLAAYAYHDGSKISTSGLIFTSMLCIGSALILLVSSNNNRSIHLLLVIAVFFSLFFVIASGIDNTITRMAEYGILCMFPLLGNTISEAPGSYYKSTPIIFRLTVSKAPVNYYKLIAISLLMTACAFRFFICFCYLGFNDTVPYTSSLFGI